MASASATVPGGIPMPIVARRRLPIAGSNATMLTNGTAGDGAPVMHPGTPPRPNHLRSSAQLSYTRPSLALGRLPPRLPYPDIGHLGKWSVSSAKFGFGPECLTDDDPDTFWQYVAPSSIFPRIQMSDVAR